MLNRRLIILFALFVLGFAALGMRLATLQLTDAGTAQDDMRKALHRVEKIETSRGQILDRNGISLARDVVCDDLAIDYRAMNLDDLWLTNAARARLKNEKFASYEDRLYRIKEMKAALAARIDTFPDVIAQVCNLSKEDVLERFQEIRQRIQALHEDAWSRRYNRENPDAAPLADDDAEANDNFRRTDILDERSAHTIVHNLPNDLANYFRQHAEELPGLIVRDNSTTRAYGPPLPPDVKPDPTFAESACQVVGTLRTLAAGAPLLHDDLFQYPDLLRDETPGNLAGYLAGDEVGESGAERLLQPQLHGARGVRLDERYQSNAEPEKRIDPVPGKDVKLTLDIALQHDLYNALKDPSKRLLYGQDPKYPTECPIALVIMSLDGQVLSMISLPTYDPNAIDTLRAQLNADEAHRPLANRALEGYQPGSTVKPLLATAALTEGVITPETTITCNGYLFPNRPGAFRCSIYVETNGRVTHGPLQLEDAIAQSCNIYFYNVGRMLGLEKLTHWFDLYGIGQNTGFELEPRDPKGFLPSTDALADPDAAKTEALFLGIGQGRVNATPLQMANAYATLLRGGLDIAPRLLLDEPQKRQQRFTLDPSIVATVKAGMRAVITRGTAKEIFAHFKLPIAGKTGTADTSRPAFDDQGQPLFDPTRPRVDDNGKPLLDAQGKPIFSRVSQSGTDAWFMAYAPVSEDAPPKFIIAAVMEFGGYGGKAAAPMVKEALLQLERHHYLDPLDVDNGEAMR
jgi:cell division protein FtsI/penicillin-binding protein 2